MFQNYQIFRPFCAEEYNVQPRLFDAIETKPKLDNQNLLTVIQLPLYHRHRSAIMTVQNDQEISKFKLQINAFILKQNDNNLSRIFIWRKLAIFLCTKRSGENVVLTDRSIERRWVG